jgi:hypothetical protein
VENDLAAVRFNLSEVRILSSADGRDDMRATSSRQVAIGTVLEQGDRHASRIDQLRIRVKFLERSNSPCRQTLNRGSGLSFDNLGRYSNSPLRIVESYGESYFNLFARYWPGASGR